MFWSSAGVTYGVRALSYLAGERQRGRRCLVQEIADATGLPVHYLRQVLHDLARAGLLRSRKGPGGGFQLTRPPEEISLIEVLTVLGVADQMDRCAVGFAECSDDFPCPLHDSWSPVRKRVKRYLETVSLAELADATQGKLTDDTRENGHRATPVAPRPIDTESS